MTMDMLDKKLLRANELFFAGADKDDEIADLLPDLVEAGYVEESGHSQTGLFWSFTPAGIARSKQLGAFDEATSDPAH